MFNIFKGGEGMTKSLRFILLLPIFFFRVRLTLGTMFSPRSRPSNDASVSYNADWISACHYRPFE